MSLARDSSLHATHTRTGLDHQDARQQDAEKFGRGGRGDARHTVASSQERMVSMSSRIKTTFLPLPISILQAGIVRSPDHVH